MPRNREIKTTFATATPESAEHGDHDDHGWVDEGGLSMEVDDSDDDEETPVTKAIKYLRREGASEPSSSAWHPGVWYSTGFSTSNCRTGEEREESFHLYGFTDDEQHEIFMALTGRVS